MNKLLIFFFSIISLFTLSCSNGQDNVDYYKKLVSSELKMGSSNDEILSFFKKHNFPYDYFDHSEVKFAKHPYKYYFSKVYEQNGVRLTKKTIVLIIILDNNLNFKNSIVEEYFTGL